MKRFLFVFFSSSLIFMAFLRIGSFSLGFLAYFSFLPLCFFIENDKKPFLTGFLFGFISYLFILYWVPFSNVEKEARPYVILGFFILLLYLSIYTGITFFLYKKTNYKIFFPIIFSGFEFLRSLSSSFGFPWGSIAYTQSYYRYLIQITDVGGVPLLTSIIIFINYILYLYLKKRKLRYIFMIFVIFLFLIIYSIFDIKTLKYEKKKISVNILQLNISPYDKRYNGYDIRLKTIRDMMKGNAELYILPESSSPCNAINYENCREIFNKLSDSLNTGIVVGTIEFEKDKRFKYFNSAAFFENGELKDVYRKIYLVPFVERLPYNDVFPFINKIDFGQGIFYPGKSYTIFNIKGIKFCTLICFEQIFPRLLRRFVRKGIDIIINITEDAWFGKTLGPYEHFENSILRAVEYKKPVLRCANSGISAYIDPTGKIIEKTKLFERKIIYAEVPIYTRKTVYTMIGDFFGWTFVIIIIVLFILSSKKKYFKHRTAIVEKYASVGKNTKIWHFSHIMGTVGKNCNIGQNVFIGKNAKVGNNVKIQNGVNIYALVEIGDNCFIGPEVTFTHNKYPRSFLPKHDKWLYTIVEEGVTIGANATILCGLKIGKYAMVGAGSVVTKDVEQFTIVCGNPAKKIGYVCVCGEKLSFKENIAKCSCGRSYKKIGDIVDFAD